MFIFFIETVGPDGPLPLEETIFIFDGLDRVGEIERKGHNAAIPVVEDVAGIDDDKRSPTNIEDVKSPDVQTTTLV